MQNNGAAKCAAYGNFLGNRYKNFPNIIWSNGNDFQSWTNPNDDALVLAVANGIKATDPNHLQTCELNYFASSSRDDLNWSNLISLNGAYTYYPTYAQVLHSYNQSNLP